MNEMSFFGAPGIRGPRAGLAAEVVRRQLGRAASGHQASMLAQLVQALPGVPAVAAAAEAIPSFVREQPPDRITRL